MPLGLRNKTAPGTAKQYASQIQKMLHEQEDLKSPDQIYENLISFTEMNEGKDSTRYAWASTLKSFLSFVRGSHKSLWRNGGKRLYQKVIDWLPLLKQHKAKRTVVLKDQNIERINKVKNPVIAIENYEATKSFKERQEIRNSGTDDRKAIETLLADIVLRIICRQGQRIGAFRGIYDSYFFCYRRW